MQPGARVSRKTTKERVGSVAGCFEKIMGSTLTRRAGLVALDAGMGEQLGLPPPRSGSQDCRLAHASRWHGCHIDCSGCEGVVQGEIVSTETLPEARDPRSMWLQSRQRSKSKQKRPTTRPRPAACSFGIIQLIVQAGGEVQAQVPKAMAVSKEGEEAS